jgi:DNA-binding response OmpR family regulator
MLCYRKLYINRMNLILIIDDEEALHDGCRQELEKSGYTVLTTGEGV